MMAPSRRLLLWTAWLGLPLGLAAAVAPALALPCAAIAVAAAFLVVSDLARGLKRPLGVSVEAPALARYSRDRAGTYTLTLVQFDPAPRARAIRVGIPFPDALGVDDPVRTAILPPETGKFPLAWDCLPVERGRHEVGRVFIERSSPLGFWAIRGEEAIHSEIRIYPNLIAERNRLASLFLNRDAAGVHAQRLVGKGREFEQLREYLPGDSYEDIHWKATARRGHPITKTYQVERTQEVYVVVDNSRLSARPIPSRSGQAEPQLELLLRAALLLGLVAERQGDFFGLLAFSDQVHSFIRAGKGRGHFNRCREALYTLQPRLVNPDFEEICNGIRLRLRRRALVVFLTNLDDPVLAESLSRNLELLSGRHLVMVNMVTPGHVRPHFSAGEVTPDDEIYAQLGGHLQWHALRETQKGLHRHGVDLHLTGHESLCGDLVAQYVSVKQRQLI